MGEESSEFFLLPCHHVSFFDSSRGSPPFYCWWFRNPTITNPANNGIHSQPQLVSRTSEPSTALLHSFSILASTNLFCFFFFVCSLCFHRVFNFFQQGFGLISGWVGSGSGGRFFNNWGCFWVVFEEEQPRWRTFPKQITVDGSWNRAGISLNSSKIEGKLPLFWRAYLEDHSS